MHDQHQNGRASWGTPSPTDILLSEFRSEMRTDVREIREGLGEVRENVAKIRGEQRLGQWQTENAIRSLFAKTDRLQVDVAGLKARSMSELARPSTPPPTEAAGLLSGPTKFLVAAKDVLPDLREILAALLVLAVALGLVAPHHAPPAVQTPATSAAP